MTKKNLVFILPNFSFGGAGKSILNICKNLNKKKYEIYALSLNKNYYKKELSNYCKEVVEIKSPSTLFSLKKINNYLSDFDKNNTIIISNINYANALFTIYFKIINKFKIILVERTPLQELFIYFGFKDFVKKFVIKIIAKIFYRYADDIIANSKKTASDFTIFTKKKCRYIYPLTLDNIIMAKKKTLKKNQKINILTISRLSKEKNLLEQLKAIKNLKSKRFILNILGDGDQKNEIKKYIKDNNIKAKIYKYSDQKKLELFKKSKLYICSSLFEGFPNAVVEAINYNLPIISSINHGGIKEIILNGRGGQLYYSGDEKGLIKKIMNIKNNYNLNAKKALYSKRFLSRFTKLNIKQYEKIFDKT